MIEFPQALKAHLESGTTTVCYAWIVRRQDGVALGFTDHDRPLTVAATQCLPDSGFSASAMESALGLGADAAEVQGALSSGVVTQEDIELGKFDGAIVDLYLVNWTAPDQVARLRRHRISTITARGEAFFVELESLSGIYDRRDGRHFNAHCDADFGDLRCGVNADPLFNVQGQVSAAQSGTTLIVSLPEEKPNGWFDNGMLAFLSGAASGTRMPIATVRKLGVPGQYQVVLATSLAVTPQQGDGVAMTAGCDKRFETCKAKFDNHLNFRGFPHMPGNDKALGYVSANDVFDGQPLVP